MFVSDRVGLEHDLWLMNLSSLVVVGVVGTESIVIVVEVVDILAGHLGCTLMVVEHMDLKESVGCCSSSRLGIHWEH